LSPMSLREIDTFEARIMGSRMAFLDNLKNR
jgi:hypothetical protein